MKRTNQLYFANSNVVNTFTVTTYKDTTDLEPIDFDRCDIDMYIEERYNDIAFKDLAEVIAHDLIQVAQYENDFNEYIIDIDMARDSETHYIIDEWLDRLTNLYNTLMLYQH